MIFDLRRRRPSGLVS